MGITLRMQHLQTKIRKFCQNLVKKACMFFFFATLRKKSKKSASLFFLQMIMDSCAFSYVVSVAGKVRGQFVRPAAGRAQTFRTLFTFPSSDDPALSALLLSRLLRCRSTLLFSGPRRSGQKSNLSFLEAIFSNFLFFFSCRFVSSS